MTRTISGTYGSSFTPCDIFICDGWYAVDGSLNVNHTDERLLVNGVDVETLPDDDAFTAGAPISSESDIESAVEM